MKHKKPYAVIGVIFLLALSGCNQVFYKKSSNGSSSVIRATQFSQQGSLFFSYYDATKRSSLTYITPQGQPRILAENNPDAAANRAFDLISKLNLSHAGRDSLTASNQLSMAKTIVQLTQKSPTDIFVRDALYRLNEMYLNTLCLNCDTIKTDKCDTCLQSLTRMSYERLFNRVLTTAEAISATDAKVEEQQTKQMEIARDSTIKHLTDSLKMLRDSVKDAKHS